MTAAFKHAAIGIFVLVTSLMVIGAWVQYTEQSTKRAFKAGFEMGYIQGIKVMREKAKLSNQWI